MLYFEHARTKRQRGKKASDLNHFLETHLVKIQSFKLSNILKYIW